MFFVLLFTYFTDVQAQDKIEYPFFKGEGRLCHYVSSQMISDAGVNMAACKRFITAVQFNINEKGHVDRASIKISENARGYLRNKLTEVILSTHGTWDPMKINGKPVKSYPLLLLVYFNIEGNCQRESNYVSNDKMYETIDNVFQFSNDSAEEPPVNTIVLKPARIYVPSMGPDDIGDHLEKNEN